MIEFLADVPEGCVIIREHIPITNLFGCLWFNEVDRFTSRDQLSFSTVRDKVMAKINWSVNMFLDCERRNFVIQVCILISRSVCMVMGKQVLSINLSASTFFMYRHTTETFWSKWLHQVLRKLNIH